MTEAGQHAVQGATDLAIADDPDIGAVQKPRAHVAFTAPLFGAVPESEVGIDDAAKEVDRKGKADFGDGLCEDGQGGDDMDAALEQAGVGHVVEKIAFDVQHGAQRCQAFEKRLGN